MCKYLFASDEQGRDPQQLEAVCSHRGGGKKAVQSVHRQAQRFEGETELAMHGDQPAKQLTAGFRRYLPGGRWGEDRLSLAQRRSASGTSQKKPRELPWRKAQRRNVNALVTGEKRGSAAAQRAMDGQGAGMLTFVPGPRAACVYTLPCVILRSIQ